MSALESVSASVDLGPARVDPVPAQVDRGLEARVPAAAGPDAGAPLAAQAQCAVMAPARAAPELVSQQRSVAPLRRLPLQALVLALISVLASGSARRLVEQRPLAPTQAGQRAHLVAEQAPTRNAVSPLRLQKP